MPFEITEHPDNEEIRRRAAQRKSVVRPCILCGQENGTCSHSQPNEPKRKSVALLHSILRESVTEQTRGYVVKERLYLDAKGNIVKANDPTRLTLFAVPGRVLSPAEAVKYGFIKEGEVVDPDAVDFSYYDRVRELNRRSRGNKPEPETTTEESGDPEVATTEGTEDEEEVTTEDVVEENEEGTDEDTEDETDESEDESEETEEEEVEKPRRKKRRG